MASGKSWDRGIASPPCLQVQCSRTRKPPSPGVGCVGLGGPRRALGHGTRLAKRVMSLRWNRASIPDRCTYPYRTGTRVLLACRFPPRSGVGSWGRARWDVHHEWCMEEDDFPAAVVRCWVSAAARRPRSDDLCASNGRYASHFAPRRG